MSDPVSLLENESVILEELTAAQGNPVDIEGYRLADNAMVTSAMRPCATMNVMIDAM